MNPQCPVRTAESLCYKTVTVSFSAPLDKAFKVLISDKSTMSYFATYVPTYVRTYVHTCTKYACMYVFMHGMAGHRCPAWYRAHPAVCLLCHGGGVGWLTPLNTTPVYVQSNKGIVRFCVRVGSFC